MASAPIRRLRAPVESPVWGWLGGAAGGLAGALLGGLLALPLLAAAAVLLPCYLLGRRLLLAAHLLWHRKEGEGTVGACCGLCPLPCPWPSTGFPWFSAAACPRVSGTEACWLSSRTGTASSALHAVLVLDAGPAAAHDGAHTALDVGRLRDLVATRLLPLYPRLAARPQSMPLAAGKPKA